jgi:hypothetical protein
MRNLGVIFERVSLICDNTSVISLAKKLVLHKRMRHLESRHHFLRDHVEKEEIKIRYIDTERQLTDIFTKPLTLLALLLCGGKLVYAILMAWFEGELLLYLVYLYLLFFSSIFIILT